MVNNNRCFIRMVIYGNRLRSNLRKYSFLLISRGNGHLHDENIYENYIFKIKYLDVSGSIRDYNLLIKIEILSLMFRTPKYTSKIASVLFVYIKMLLAVSSTLKNKYFPIL